MHPSHYVIPSFGWGSFGMAKLGFWASDGTSHGERFAQSYYLIVLTQKNLQACGRIRKKQRCQYLGTQSDNLACVWVHTSCSGSQSGGNLVSPQLIWGKYK